MISIDDSAGYMWLRPSVTHIKGTGRTGLPSGPARKAKEGQRDPGGWVLVNFGQP